MGVSFVNGLQGNDPKYFKVIATPKHYAVHSGPEPSRHVFDAVIDNYDLYNTYLPAFKACIRDAGAFSIMCAYNRFMGDACCGSPVLLKNILRNDWDFKGYVVSDCGAIDDIFKNHKIVQTAPEASALAVKSGTDLECGNVYVTSLMDAVKKGLLSEDDINKAVKRLFTARFKLGMFDPPELVKYSQIPIEENNSEPHRLLSLQAARESIVLLKNENNILPLKKGYKKIAVIGPTADSYPMLLGNYYGTPSEFVTPLQGIINKVKNINQENAGETEVAFQQGCDLIEPGGIVHDLYLNIVNLYGKPELKAEYYNNTNLEGKPYLTTDNLSDNYDWIKKTRLPDSIRTAGFSIRWTGKITVPETGEYNFILKGDDGYRFYINGKLIVEDWTIHQISTNSNKIHLEKNTNYDIKIEFFSKEGWPHLYIQCEYLDLDYVTKAVDIAKASDIIIFVGGITSQLEGEEMPVEYEGFRGGDRTNLNLPKPQEELLKKLYSTGKPIILILTSGSALSVNWENENIPAIVQLWYPGQEGGTALADVLFGDYNPGGRLPVTFYKSADQLPPFEDYNMKGRTYRYFKDKPLFPFGYGLSYTNFKYEKFLFPDIVKTGDSVKVLVEVMNTGKVKGDEVVQIYLTDMDTLHNNPIHSLLAFKRIQLNPLEKKLVEFTLQPQQFGYIKSLEDDQEHVQYIIEPGYFEITAGGLQPGTTASTTEVITKMIKLEGKTVKLKW